MPYGAGAGYYICGAKEPRYCGDRSNEVSSFTHNRGFQCVLHANDEVGNSLAVAA